MFSRIFLYFSRDLYDVSKLPLAVQLVLNSRLLPSGINEEFRSGFFNSLTSCVIEQIAIGNKNYLFLSERFDSLNEEIPRGSTQKLNEDVSLQNFDVILKQILENKLKFHQRRNCIFLSSVTAATVSAASSAIRGSQSGKESEDSTTPDSVVFTCNHNFPRYYVIDVILPELRQRLSGLPKPLPQTADLLVHYYTQMRTQIPAACPCCVYNNLRQEQLHLLQETGGEMSGNKSTFWEV